MLARYGGAVMRLSVTFNGGYANLHIDIDMGEFDSGLLDSTEAQAMAIQLLSCAEDLLSSSMDDEIQAIQDARHKLEES